MILIVAKFKIKEGSVTAFSNYMAGIEAKVAANEPGCVFYRVAVSRTEPNTFMNIEVFRDQAALDFHTSCDYFLEGNGVVAPWLDGPPQAEFLDILD